MSFLVLMDSCMVFLLAGFNAWNWFLACTGLSTLEFLDQYNGISHGRFDYSFDRVRDNLFKIFGT